MQILKVKVDNLTTQEAVTQSLQLLKDGKKHYIATINPEFIVAAQSDFKFRDILNHSALSLADGMGLIWASKVLGQPLKSRIPGTDFIYHLAALAEKENFNIYFLGGQPAVAELAAQKLKESFPRLKIAGTSFVNPGSIPEDLKNKKIDILLVAYGHSKQEKWIDENLAKLKVSLAMGVGGAFDYISGRKRRAPKWTRFLGFEWLFRLVYEPWRLKRQLALPYFVLLVLKEKFLP